MKVSDKEKPWFDKLQSLCKRDKKTIKDVLISILTMMTLEEYEGNDEVVIPYIGTIKFNYNDETTSKGRITKVTLEMEPSQTMINEFSAISDGEKTPSEKHYQKLLQAYFTDKLDNDEAKERIEKELEEDDFVDEEEEESV